jgi:fatty-acid desaturase
VTVYLHRCQAHRALQLHPAVAHAFRFWLSLSTGMVTRGWDCGNGSWRRRRSCLHTWSTGATRQNGPRYRGSETLHVNCMLMADERAWAVTLSRHATCRPDEG